MFTGLTLDELQLVRQRWINLQPDPVKYREYPEYEGADGAIVHVTKLTIEQPDLGTARLDWVLYDLPNVHAIVDSFDHSVSMFYAELVEGALVIKHRGDWGVCTRNLTATCPAERAERFKEYAGIVGWTYNEGTQDA